MSEMEQFNPEPIVAVTEQFDEKTAQYIRSATEAELRAHLTDDVHPALSALAEGLLQQAAFSEQITAELQASAAGATMRHAMVSGLLLDQAGQKLRDNDDPEAHLLALEIDVHLGKRTAEDVREEWDAAVSVLQAQAQVQADTETDTQPEPKPGKSKKKNAKA